MPGHDKPFSRWAAAEIAAKVQKLGTHEQYTEIATIIRDVGLNGKGCMRECSQQRGEIPK